MNWRLVSQCRRSLHNGLVGREKQLRMPIMIVLPYFISLPHSANGARNLDNLRTLIDQRGKDYRFIGISLSQEGLEEYLSIQTLPFPVYIDIPKESGDAYKMGGTPQTVVVSSQGQVLQSWVGAYVGDQKSQVEAYFKVTLPGVSGS